MNECISFDIAESEKRSSLLKKASMDERILQSRSYLRSNFASKM